MARTTSLIAMIIGLTLAGTASAKNPTHPAWLVGHYAEGSTAHCYQGQSTALLPNGLWTTAFSDSAGGTWSYDRGDLIFRTLFVGGEPDFKPSTSRSRIRWTKHGYDLFIHKSADVRKSYT